MKREYTPEEIQIMANVVWRQILRHDPLAYRRFMSGKSSLAQETMWSRLDTTPHPRMEDE